VITINLIEQTACRLQMTSESHYAYGRIAGAIWAQEMAARESRLAREWLDVLHTIRVGQRCYMDAEEFGFDAKLAGEYALTDMVHP